MDKQRHGQARARVYVCVCMYFQYHQKEIGLLSLVVYRPDNLNFMQVEWFGNSPDECCEN